MNSFVQFPMEIITILFFFAAAAADLKERKVSDRLWISMIVCLFPFLIFDFISDISFCIDSIISGDLSSCTFLWKTFFRILVPAFLFVSGNYLFRAGLFGGADIKAMMIFAFAFPEISFTDSVFPEIGPFKIPGIIPVLMATSVFTSSVFVFCFLMNLKSRKFVQRNKFQNIFEFILAILTSYPENILKAKHFFLSERYDFENPGKNGNFLKKFVLNGIDPDNEYECGYVERLKFEISMGNISEIQRISPKLPFLVPFSLGVLSVFAVTLI